MIGQTEKPELQKLLDYVKSKGKQGERTIEILGKNYKFLNAFNTEIGQDLLIDLCGKHESLLNKISRLEATDADRMEYKVVYELIMKWSDKISAYYDAVKKVNEAKA